MLSHIIICISKLCMMESLFNEKVSLHYYPVITSMELENYQNISVTCF